MRSSTNVQEDAENNGHENVGREIDGPSCMAWNCRTERYVLTIDKIMFNAVCSSLKKRKHTSENSKLRCILLQNSSNFMSCFIIFMSCNFDGPSFSCRSFKSTSWKNKTQSYRRRFELAECFLLSRIISSYVIVIVWRSDIVSFPARTCPLLQAKKCHPAS